MVDPSLLFYLFLKFCFCIVFSGASCFFVRPLNYYPGGCIRDIGQVQSNGSWGSLYFAGISYEYNSCLHPAAQFRFLDNGAMLSLKRQGCLAAFNRNGSGFNVDMFYVYVGSEAACVNNPNKGIYRALNQSKEAGLTVYYKENRGRSFQIWCALVSYNTHFRNKFGTRGFGIVTLTQHCHLKNKNYEYYRRRFNFGKFFAQ